MMYIQEKMNDLEKNQTKEIKMKAEKMKRKLAELN